MIQTKPLPAALLAALVLTAPAAVTAQTLIDATQVDSIATIARAYGEAVVEKDTAGDPMISGQIDRTNYVVFFYGCTDGADCTTIQFMSSYTNTEGVDANVINTWNRDKRFGKAYLDGEGDPVVEMNVNLWSGVSENNLNDTFDWWRLVLEGFQEHIGFEHADDPVTPAADAGAPVTRDAEADTPAAATANPTALGVGSGTLGGGSKVKINR